ncbi:MAG: hypothetical protein R3304_07370 [Longimicrobiales bacterium]|nr:hypothetical protein [Longimicrobiales bacterium]
MRLSRPAAVLGATVLVACGPSPTEPAMDFPVLAEIVADPGDPSTLTYTFNDVTGDCMVLGGTAGLYEDLTFPDPAPVVPCTTANGTIGLRPSNFAFAAPSEILVGLPSPATSVSLDVYLNEIPLSGEPTLFGYDGSDMIVSTAQGGAVGAWTTLTVSSSDPAIESIGLLMPEWITDMDDLTVTWVASEPAPGPADPESRFDCMDGGWEGLGFRNQGQCVRLSETGQDSR